MGRKPLHAYMTLLAYLLSGGLGGSGTLCIGADGHVEVESASTGCCAVENCDPPAGQEDPCGPCLDIPLLNEHIQSKGVQEPVASPTNGAIQPAISPLIRIFNSTQFVRREVYLIDPGGISSAHLESIILLC